MTAPNADTSVNYLFLPLQPYLSQEGVTELAINRENEVWVEKNSTWERHEVELSFDTLESMATSVAAHAQNSISITNPILSSVLPGGERIQFVIPPAVKPGMISVTIRKPGGITRQLSDYQESGYFEHIQPISSELKPLDKELSSLLEKSAIEDFLKLAIELKKTIVIAGGTGSGKTTFMKALMELIPRHERLITIEDVQELFLPNHPNKVNLFYPSEATLDDPLNSAKLLKSCLRMKPDRMMLAELRGAETFDFINIAASGHGGSITSCHANSAKMTFSRLALMVLQNPQGRCIPYNVILELLYQVIDIVIHVDNDVHSENPLGRHITEIYFDPQKQMGGMI